MRLLNVILLMLSLLLLAGCQMFSYADGSSLVVTDAPVATAETAVSTPQPEPTQAPTIAPEPTEAPTAEPTAMPEPTVEPTAVPEPTAITFELAPETAVIDIPLTEPLAKRTSEISGMAWYGDWLILMPQYPFFNREGADGALYALHKDEIEAFINGDSTAPLDPQPIPFNSSDLRHQIQGYEGYESIAFVGDEIYMTIEANSQGSMQGYLVHGSIAPDLSAITILTQTAVINPQAPIDNMSDETVLIVGDQVLTMYESNGLQYNPAPVAHVFAADLAENGTLPFPRMEYRVTDATALDENGRFWVINYNFPGDGKVQTDDDPIATQYGKGATHAENAGVERLVELQYSPDGISMTDTPPVQLQLLSADGNNLRNWEGIVRFNGGWLLATDRYPITLFGYVPPQPEE